MITQPTLTGRLPGPTTIPQSLYMPAGTTSRARVVHVSTVAELDAWYQVYRSGSSVAVGGRYEHRDGALWPLGGLSWQLSLPAYALTVVLETAEGETLPDLPIVRACWPYGLNRAVAA